MGGLVRDQEQNGVGNVLHILQALSIDELEDYRFPLYMAQMKHRWLSPAVAAFRKFLLEQVEQSRLSSLTEA